MWCGLAEYIAREAAIAVLRMVAVREASTNFYTAMLAELKGIPAADVVEVVHAHWIVEDGCAYCSDCRNNFKKAIMTHSKFCPMCGAKMDGGQNE